MEAVKEKVKLQKYPAYKDFGVEWLGEIPEHWKIAPGFSFLYEAKEKNIGFKRKQVLSLSYGKIREKGEEELTGLVPESFETYQLVDAGDIIFRPTDLQNDKVSLRSAMSDFDGIITSAYLNLRLKKIADARFYHYFFRTIDNNKVIYGLGSGLRQNIDYRDFRRFRFPFPPKQEQSAIANFLDDKCGKIDTAIAQKQQLIELLKERKQIIIQNAVTKGLDPCVKMKDSGVEWIGEIPEHWEVVKNKTLFRESNKPGEEGIPLLMVSIHSAVSSEEINDEDNIRGRVKIEDKTKYKLVEEHDVVFNMMRAWQGAIGAVSVKGLVSPAYIVATPNQKLNSQYFEYLYRTDSFIQQMNQNSKGITDFRKRLYWDEFKQLITVLPPKKEQNKIVEFIDELNQKIINATSLQEQQIEKLREYKSSLIDAAVTGKIKVS